MRKKMITTAKSEKHGRRGSLEYSSWYNMKTRCTNENYIDYKHYGGRGISVCDDWARSFTRFLDDMGHRPNPSYTLDRIDTNKGYFKDNCRWATKSEQTLNRRNITKKSGLPKGVSPQSETINRYRSRIWIEGKEYALGSFANPELASRAFCDMYYEWYGIKNGGDV